MSSDHLKLLPCDEHKPDGDPMCPYCIALAAPKIERCPTCHGTGRTGAGGKRSRYGINRYPCRDCT